MRKLAEKIAIVAQICITLVFAVITILSLTNAFYYDNADSNVNAQGNSVLTALVFALVAAYLGLSAYILYVNFSEKENIKRVLLFCDSESATHTTTKVAHRIVRECAKQTKGIKVKKTRIRPDEKQGLALNLKINVVSDNVSQEVDTFRCLLADSFANTLGLSFNSINFEVSKLTTNYAPNSAKADEMAEKLGDQREIVAEIYNEPMDNDINLDCVVEDKKKADKQQNDDAE